MSYIGNRLADASSQNKAIFDRIILLHASKLWHQLTEELKNVVLNPDIDDKQGLYTHFVREFEAKLNPVFLVQILIGIARSDLVEDVPAALQFLEPHLTS
jgi:hypothetical protein